MTNREICDKVLDTFSDDQLVHVATMLLSLRQIVSNAEDGAAAQRSYAAYFSAADSYQGFVLPEEEAEKIRREKEKYR